MEELDVQQRLTKYIGQETAYWDFWGAFVSSKTERFTQHLLTI